MKSYLGNSSHRKIQNIVQKNQIKKVFLVTNRNSFTAGGVSHYIFQVLNGCEYVRFSDFSTNPKLEDVKKGIESYWANGANKESKSYALKALEYLVPSICDVVAVPTSCVKRKNGSWRILCGKSD